MKFASFYFYFNYEREKKIEIAEDSADGLIVIK